MGALIVSITMLVLAIGSLIYFNIQDKEERRLQSRA